jgi:hypothetical protein
MDVTTHQKNTRKALDEIAREAIERGISIIKYTFDNVEILLNLMPVYGIEPPGLGIEADGGILLEWYNPRVSDVVVSVIINGERAVFASLGADNQRGGGAISLPRGGVFFVLQWVLGR